MLARVFPRHNVGANCSVFMCLYSQLSLPVCLCYFCHFPQLSLSFSAGGLQRILWSTLLYGHSLLSLFAQTIDNCVCVSCYSVATSLPILRLLCLTEHPEQVGCPICLRSV